MTVFDTSTTKATRVRYILKNEAAADLVLSWWPSGSYAIYARMASQPNSLTMASLAWDDFREALELLLEAGEAESVEREDFRALLSCAAPLVQGAS